MSHADKCVLARLCTLREGPKCSTLCGSYIAMHGHNGEGGRIGNGNLPAAYLLVTLDNSPARTEQSEIYGSLSVYVRTFTRQFGDETKPEPIKSLYLYSRTPGTGKTTTAAALLSEWITVHYVGSLRRGQQPVERPAYFLDINGWQTDYNEFNRPRVPEHIAEPAAARYYAARQRAMTVPFAVLDDIGVREPTEGFRADLHSVINARVTAGLPTVYTSNVPLDELHTVFGERRLADRIRDLCMEFTFKGESHRGMRKV
ncbi:ATP-binding protein [Paenibacillus pinihumi]|uniref:ATP-binding protein n=1 Tax=Paenibacillus pinihumi TaxID=669462 RepID=UPI0003F65126|nr:ATP-binding protein [Paenibacillus pinihumi]